MRNLYVAIPQHYVGYRPIVVPKQYDQAEGMKIAATQILQFQMVIAIALVYAPRGAEANESQETSPNEERVLGLDVETNPIFLALDGYFFKLGGSPKGSNWSYSAVVLRANISRDMADMSNGRNKDRGFGDEEIRHGSVGIDVGRYWGRDHDGLHASASLNIFRMRVEHGEEEGRFTTFAPAIRVGYRWFPSSRRVFFVEPAVALGTQVRIAGDKKVADVSYRSGGLLKAAGFHLGLRI